MVASDESQLRMMIVHTKFESGFYLTLVPPPCPRNGSSPLSMSSKSMRKKSPDSAAGRRPQTTL